MRWLSFKISRQPVGHISDVDIVNTGLRSYQNCDCLVNHFIMYDDLFWKNTETVFNNYIFIGVDK